jgi:DNA-binding MarR family transcriptional regulator
VPNRHLYLQASTAAQYVGQILEHQLAPLDIPPVLLALLTHVRDHEPVAPTDLARAAGSPPTTLRDNIQRLVDRRLVRRSPNPDDGRSYLLTLTARGRGTLREADPALLRAYRALERHLPRRRETYEAMFDELIAAFEEAAADLIDPPEQVSARRAVYRSESRASPGAARRRTGPLTESGR